MIFQRFPPRQKICDLSISESFFLLVLNYHCVYKFISHLLVITHTSISLRKHFFSLRKSVFLRKPQDLSAPFIKNTPGNGPKTWLGKQYSFDQRVEDLSASIFLAEFLLSMRVIIIINVY